MTLKSIRRTEPYADAWVGPWLRGIREARGIRAAAIVRALAGKLSVDSGRLSHFERGRSSFRADQVPELLVAYEVTLGAYMDEVGRRVAALRPTGTGGVAHVHTVDQSR